MTPQQEQQIKVAVDSWHVAANQAAYAEHRFRQTFYAAFLQCPPNGDGKAPAEYLRKAYAEAAALDAERDAQLAQIEARAREYTLKATIRAMGDDDASPRGD